MYGYVRPCMNIVSYCIVWYAFSQDGAEVVEAGVRPAVRWLVGRGSSIGAIIGGTSRGLLARFYMHARFMILLDSEVISACTVHCRRAQRHVVKHSGELCVKS